jgi:hypothetical protein
MDMSVAPPNNVGVASLQRSQVFIGRDIHGGIIHNNHLKARIRLRDLGLERTTKQCRSFVGWNDDAEHVDCASLDQLL